MQKCAAYFILMKIVINDYIKENTDDIGLASLNAEYIQNPDNTEGSEADYQKLLLETRNGGGGHYLHIVTKGWSISFSQLEDFLELLKDFKDRLMLNGKNDSN